MTGKTATTSARQADPCTLIIFGASGDLTHRLLLPALYNLAASGLLPEHFALIGVARSESTGEAFRDDLAKCLPKFATRDIDERVVKKQRDATASQGARGHEIEPGGVRECGPGRSVAFRGELGRAHLPPESDTVVADRQMAC